MKPVKLEFSGINSFSEHTIIDFDALSAGGIFGIFGETGSGKSTILDAINFALYGDVERSSEKTDIINYRSAAAYVKFTFYVLSEGKNKLYTVTRTLKKDKNGTHKAELYEKCDDKELCIADKAKAVGEKITEILGVNADDFRKCIALPQGEFSQFVKSTTADRIKLIERLFSLGKYGERLKEKLAARQSETENRFQNVSGRLVGFADVSEERIKELGEELAGLEKTFTDVNARLEKYRKEYERVKKLNEKREELKGAERALEAARTKKPEMEKLRERIGAIPVCRDIVRLSDTAQDTLTKLNKTGADAAALEKSLKACESETERLAKELEEGNFDEKLQNCSVADMQNAMAGSKPEQLKEMKSELEARRSEYRKLEEEKKRYLSELETAEKRAEKLDNEIKESGSGDLADAFGDSFRGALLKGEYAYSLDWFARFNGDVDGYDDGSPLYGFVKGEVGKKISEYKTRLSDVRDFDITEAESRLAKIKADAERQRQLGDALVKARENVQKIKAALAVTENRLDAALSGGKEIKARIDATVKELTELFGAKYTDIDELKKRNDAELERLTAQKKGLAARLDAAREKLTNTKIDLEKLGALTNSLRDRYAETQKSLETLFDGCFAKSADECRVFLGEYADADSATGAIAEFDAEYAALSAKVAELSKVDGIDGADAERLSEAEKNKLSAESETKKLTGDIAVCRAGIDTLNQRLGEKKGVEKELAGIKAERDNLARLREVTKSNRFLEYIATEYLTDIAALASKTLLTLTDGRYYLVYDAANFRVSDNYDGGNLRGVNTLSGGETFLVSLSLALALSQTICAKSDKTIEFFFLDEGFGTLDSNLVETVMTALEKLKSSRFTIGVISHVEELKQRIENKITVIKATEDHGSSVKISY